jgi:DNA-binding CsgD family transcriptional regulator
MLAVLRSHPAATAFAGATAPRPARVSDLVGFRELTRTRAYRVLLAPHAVKHQIVLPLVSAIFDQLSGAYVFNRLGRDFEYRDLLLAAALQPVLTALHMSRDGDAERRDRIGSVPMRDLGLTRREHEILIHLATGMTAVAAGRALGISARTVGKHAENAYTKLRVHNRQEAINVCRRLGIIEAVPSCAVL